MEYLLLMVAVVFIGFYLFGPSRRENAGSQLPYEKAVIRTDKGGLGLTISDKRLIRDIAVSPGYPREKYQKYRGRMQILKILYLITILMALYGLDNINRLVFCLGLAGLIVSLILTSVFCSKTSGEIAEEAAVNQPLYEAVATLHGWWYDSEWYSRIVRSEAEATPRETRAGQSGDRSFFGTGSE